MRHVPSPLSSMGTEKRTSFPPLKKRTKSHLLPSIFCAGNARSMSAMARGEGMPVRNTRQPSRLHEEARFAVPMFFSIWLRAVLPLKLAVSGCLRQPVLKVGRSVVERLGHVFVVPRLDAFAAIQREFSSTFEPVSDLIRPKQPDTHLLGPKPARGGARFASGSPRYSPSSPSRIRLAILLGAANRYAVVTTTRTPARTRLAKVMAIWVWAAGCRCASGSSMMSVSPGSTTPPQKQYHGRELRDHRRSPG